MLIVPDTARQLEKRKQVVRRRRWILHMPWEKSKPRLRIEGPIVERVVILHANRARNPKSVTGDAKHRHLGSCHYMSTGLVYKVESGLHQTQNEKADQLGLPASFQNQVAYSRCMTN